VWRIYGCHTLVTAASTNFMESGEFLVGEETDRTPEVVAAARSEHSRRQTDKQMNDQQMDIAQNPAFVVVVIVSGMQL